MVPSTPAGRSGMHFAALPMSDEGGDGHPEWRSKVTGVGLHRSTPLRATRDLRPRSVAQSSPKINRRHVGGQLCKTTRIRDKSLETGA